jgi:hypothetical protein
MASRKQSKRKSAPKSKKGSRSKSASKHGSRRHSASKRGSKKTSKSLVTGGGGSGMMAGRGPEMLAMLGGIPTIELFLWESCPACNRFQSVVDEFLLAKEFDANYIFTKVYGSTPIIPGIEITSFPSIVASIPDQGISRIIPGSRTLEDLNSILYELGLQRLSSKIVDDMMPRL